jgi:hypothetical protein
MRTVEERYHNDPVFHTLVDHLYNLIANAQCTPSELREALILAATKYEMEYTSPAIIPNIFKEQ